MNLLENNAIRFNCMWTKEHVSQCARDRDLPSPARPRPTERLKSQVILLTSAERQLLQFSSVYSES